MKNKAAAVVLAVLMSVALTSCSRVTIYSQQREPDDYILIQAIGIDWTDGQIVVTASTGTGLDGEEPKIFEAKNATLSQAINDIKYGYLNEEAFFSHTSQIVIGEDAAARGIEEYLDYTARNINMRLSSNIYIVQGGTAGELIKETDGGSISATDMLMAVNDKAEYMMLGKVSNCDNIIEELEKNEYGLITAVKKIQPMEVFGKEKVGITAAGYVLIQNGKLARFIDEYEATGVAIARGEVKSGEISVTMDDGYKVTVRITEVEVSERAEYDGGPDITVRVNIKLNVEGAAGAIDLTDYNVRREIAEKAEREIQDRVSTAIEKAQRAGTDYCRIGESIYLRHPYKFRSTYLNWNEIFPECVIKTEVSTIIERTYDVADSPELQGD